MFENIAVGIEQWYYVHELDSATWTLAETVWEHLSTLILTDFDAADLVKISVD
jgi:hypothetical protein